MLLNLPATSVIVFLSVCLFFPKSRRYIKPYYQISFEDIAHEGTIGSGSQRGA